MKLIKKIMFQLPIQDVLSISYQFSVIHLWMIQPLFSCLVFFMRAVHRDNSAPLLNQEHNTFHVLRPKHLDIAPFPMLFLLSGIQPTTAFKTALKTHLRLTAVSKFSHLSQPPPPPPHSTYIGKDHFEKKNVFRLDLNMNMLCDQV